MIASGEVLEDFAEPSSFPAGISSDSVMVVGALVLLSTTDPSGIPTTVVAAAVVVGAASDGFVVGVTLVVDVLVDNRGVEDGATSNGREVVVTVDSADGVVADVLAFLVEVDGATSDDFVVVVAFVARVTVVGVVGVALVVDVLVENRGVVDGVTADVRGVVVTVVSFDDVACLVVVAFSVVVDGATSDNFVVVVAFVAWVCVVGVGLSVGDVVDVLSLIHI